MFTHALEWACPGFRDIFGAEFETQLVTQNSALNAQHMASAETENLENPLTLENLQQYEVNAPYMFEPSLPSDEEKSQNSGRDKSPDRE
jgi:hypothetical protein